MALKLVSPAETFPVTIEDAKRHLNVDFTDHDSLIEIYVAAATAHAEQFCGRAFAEQTFDYYLDAFPADGGAIKLPMPPLYSVEGVFYGPAASEQTFPADSYVVDRASAPGRVALVSGAAWPTLTEQANAVRIRFVAGYFLDDSPQDVLFPKDVRGAILLILGTLYANRETIVIGQSAVQLPWAAEQLLRPHRVHTAIG